MKRSKTNMEIKHTTTQILCFQNQMKGEINQKITGLVFNNQFAIYNGKARIRNRSIINCRQCNKNIQINGYEIIRAPKIVQEYKKNIKDRDFETTFNSQIKSTHFQDHQAPRNSFGAIPKPWFESRRQQNIRVNAGIIPSPIRNTWSKTYFSNMKAEVPFSDETNSESAILNQKMQTMLKIIESLKDSINEMKGNQDIFKSEICILK